nr:MAG TPA: hypothetical protein [Bacteriophage sp.]
MNSTRVEGNMQKTTKKKPTIIFMMYRQCA